MSGYGSNANSPGYLESVASTKRKTKEDIRIDQLIPSEILEKKLRAVLHRGHPQTRPSKAVRKFLPYSTLLLAGEFLAPSLVLIRTARDPGREGWAHT